MIVIAHPRNMSFHNKGFEDNLLYLCRTAAACCGSVYYKYDANYPITIQIFYTVTKDRL